MLWNPREDALQSSWKAHSLCEKRSSAISDFIYLFLERWEGRGRETSIGCFLQGAPQMGTKPTTQASALTGNRTSDLSLCRTMPKWATLVRTRRRVRRVEAERGPLQWLLQKPWERWATLIQWVLSTGPLQLGGSESIPSTRVANEDASLDTASHSFGGDWEWRLYSRD